jgi:hypothetical protein
MTHQSTAIDTPTINVAPFAYSPIRVIGDIVKPLADIRRELEASADKGEWPQCADRELYLLCDICASLHLTERDILHILGSSAYAYMLAHIVGQTYQA